MYHCTIVLHMYIGVSWYQYRIMRLMSSTLPLRTWWLWGALCCWSSPEQLPLSECWSLEHIPLHRPSLDLGTGKHHLLTLPIQRKARGLIWRPVLSRFHINIKLRTKINNGTKKISQLHFMGGSGTETSLEVTDLGLRLAWMQSYIQYIHT